MPVTPIYVHSFPLASSPGSPSRRFKCNVCSVLNEVPNEYFCHLDHTGTRSDGQFRPELSTGTVEYVAPSEYMVCVLLYVLYHFKASKVSL